MLYSISITKAQIPATELYAARSDISVWNNFDDRSVSKDRTKALVSDPTTWQCDMDVTHFFMSDGSKSSVCRLEVSHEEGSNVLSLYGSARGFSNYETWW